MTMKKHLYLVGLGVAAALISLLPVSGMKAIAEISQLLNSSSNLAQNVQQQPKVNLNLVADQKMVQKNAQGKEIITWKNLGSKVSVKPGDVLRFTVMGKNEGKGAAKGLNITQPVARGTMYMLGSATPVNGASLSYSINGAKTFVANPVVKVSLGNGKVEERPAPAEAYTHVRWSFSQALEPNTSVKAAYQVKVRG
jgi:uncharacterized repeat protein (TIGR01451 family)